MARSRAHRRSLALALLPAAALAAAAAPAQTPAAAQPALQVGEQPINLEASKTDIDGRTNTLVFTDVVISQGNLRVQAEHARATGLNFANSRWNFEGNVRIDAEEHGNLRSDQAVVEFKDNHIARATVTGKPAEFEQKRANSEAIARGHADEIVYDVNEGTVRLTNEAWLSDGQSEISGPLLVYNIRAQQIQGGAGPNAPAGGDQRVHIIVVPHAGTTAPKPDVPKPDTPKPEASKPGPKPTADPAPKS